MVAGARVTPPDMNDGPGTVDRRCLATPKDSKTAPGTMSGPIAAVGSMAVRIAGASDQPPPISIMLPGESFQSTTGNHTLVIYGADKVS